jgi:hypothetical protein
VPGAKTGRWLHYLCGSPPDINDLNGNMFSLHLIGLTGVQLGVLMDLIVSLLEGCRTIWQRFKLKSCWNHLGNSCLFKFSSFYTWSLSSLYWICLDAALAGCIVNSNVFCLLGSGHCVVLILSKTVILEIPKGMVSVCTR